MEALTSIIRERICSSGPITFRDFMEMALYYPGLGYYTSGTKKIGPCGDYYTAPYFTCIFSELLARQIEEMWLLTGQGDFTIVEYGAGTGIMSHDILAQLKHNSRCYNKLRYCIIEKSPAMQHQQKKVASEKIEWHESIADVSELTGCVLSNELLDNFAVHRVIMQEELMEVYVDHRDGFREILYPASGELKQYFKELNVALPKGCYAEINLEALQWMADIAASLRKGFVLTVDYGYSSEELYSMHRKKGTLMCYAKHKTNDNPYSNIGEQDITTHVNFSALRHWGELFGLRSCGYTTQSHFLHSLGLATHLREKEKNGFSRGINNVLLAHTLLTGMGNKYKVMIQQKGLDKPVLSGMQLSQGAVW